jgi:hypothetical protein
MVILCVLFFALILTTTKKFLSNQIVIKTSQRQHSIGEIPFPSVTVCYDMLVPENLTKIIESDEISVEE